MGRRGFDIKVVFGQRVRELRLAADVTQEELAERCGIFRTYLSNVERGVANPALLVIKALADSLQVPITALFSASAAGATAQSTSTGEGFADVTQQRVDVDRSGAGRPQHTSKRGGLPQRGKAASGSRGRVR
jgi:transcriptional regulator with XRE-family HTH domain